MRKFGRPDLVAIIHADDAEPITDVLLQLAAAMADGALPATPRHGVDLPHAVTLYLEPEKAGLAERIGLNNDAVILVDEQGHPLNLARGLWEKLG